MEDLKRSDDRLIGQLIQELKDFKEQNKEWRMSIDRRLEPIEKFMSNANWSWKIVVGLATLGAACIKIWHFVADHWK